MISESRLFSTILQVAEDENKYLFDHFRKGIFFMPELAFSYQCGKAVMEDKTSILGNSEYSWVREKEYKDYGFADLVFELENDEPEIVIEFKMDDTWNSYLKDVEKLRSLAGNYRRFFCSLKWVYSDQVETFMETLKNKLDSTLIGKKDLETIVKAGSRGDRCLLTLWEVRKND